MKVKASVILDLENKKIMNIGFKNKVLNRSTGMRQLKAFIRRRILNTPIQEFRIKQGFDNDPKIFYIIDLDLDVYPFIQKIEQSSKLLSYRCKLSPLPLQGKESDITFEEYEQIWRNIKGD